MFPSTHILFKPLFYFFVKNEIFINFYLETIAPADEKPCFRVIAHNISDYPTIFLGWLSNNMLI